MRTYLTIDGGTTMMTSEMLAALSSHTILRDAVSLSTTETEDAALLDGYRVAHAEGLNRALFLVRVMQVSGDTTPTERYSFFLGALLSAEIDAIRKSSAPTVQVGGQPVLRNATARLLGLLSDTRVIAFTDRQAQEATALGAVHIYEKTNNATNGCQ